MGALVTVLLDGTIRLSKMVGKQRTGSKQRQWRCALEPIRVAALLEILDALTGSVACHVFTAGRVDLW